MAKRGRSNHVKRLAVPKAVFLTDKKDFVWALNSSPGTHTKKKSLSLMILLRDILKLAQTSSEVKKVLSKRAVLVDGRVITEPKFGVGLMDVVSFLNSDVAYRIIVDNKGRLFPLPLEPKNTNSKVLRVVGKSVLSGGKISVLLHDGRNLLSDNNIRVGDSVILSLPDGKLKSHLKLSSGVRCLVREGKHVGVLVKLKDIIKRKGGKPPEALVVSEGGEFSSEFITLADYLVIVDDSFKAG